ncbi:MAG TPA: hypothetical protein VH372_24940 [Actinospica sp.]|nr:hypothetical protein [Actinospica sp.]
MNVKAPFFLTAALAPAMAEAGGGAIINLGSSQASAARRGAARGRPGDQRSAISDQQPYIDELTSWQAWHAWREAVLEHYRRQGRNCPLSVLIGQLAPDDEEAAAVVAGLLERWHGLLAAGVAAMQRQGLMRTDVEAARAADALLSGLQGGAVTLIATGRIGPLEAALELGLDALRG